MISRTAGNRRRCFDLEDEVRATARAYEVPCPLAWVQTATMCIHPQAKARSQEVNIDRIDSQRSSIIIPRPCPKHPSKPSARYVALTRARNVLPFPSLPAMIHPSHLPSNPNATWCGKGKKKRRHAPRPLRSRSSACIAGFGLLLGRTRLAVPISSVRHPRCGGFAGVEGQGYLGSSTEYISQVPSEHRCRETIHP